MTDENDIVGIYRELFDGLSKANLPAVAAFAVGGLTTWVLTWVKENPEQAEKVARAAWERLDGLYGPGGSRRSQ